MRFSSPLLSDVIQTKNLRTFKVLLLVAAGLLIFSVVFIIFAN